MGHPHGGRASMRVCGVGQVQLGGGHELSLLSVMAVRFLSRPPKRSLDGAPSWWVSEHESLWGGPTATAGG